MHIKEIVLDGFKSYGVRTRLQGFDQQFNAITGFNGTGKSNILDGICFVLGLSNLKRARVSNLHDLVYKKGQAGVKKASVSIMFDNTDKSQSPISYKDFDEITVTRSITIGASNKYLINGARVRQKAVEDFFQSVRLDVNNPNFLIMQGKVTSVQRMKPVEVLGMLQETAGTKMYDKKKAESQKRMNEKKKKLEELNTILEKEIKPKLKELYEQQKVYQKYEDTKMKKSKYDRLATAYDYQQLKLSADSGDDMIAEAQRATTEARDELATSTQNKTNFEGLVKEREAQMAASNTVLKELDIKVTDAHKQKEVQKVKVDHAKRSVFEAEGALKTHENEINNHESGMQEMDQKVQQAQELYQKQEEAVEKVKESIASKEGQLSGIGGDGKGTLKEQLMSKKKEFSDMDSRKRQIDLTMKDRMDQIRQKKHTAQRGKERWEQLRRQLSAKQDDLEKVNQEIANAGITPEEVQKGCDDLDRLEARCQELQSELRRGTDSNFTYRIEPGFRGDPSQVYGTIASLISVKDPQYFRAIGSALGSKGYHIVCRDKDVGTEIIKSASRRVNIIPLRNITHKSPDRRRLDAARQHCRDVHYAIDLVDFDERYRPAMEFVFGNTMIAPTIEHAEAIAYDRHVQCKCVTHDGDNANPAGTMEGGSVQRGPSKLEQYIKHRQKEQEYFNLNNERKKLQKEVEAMKNKFAGVKTNIRTQMGLRQIIRNTEEELNNTEYQGHQDEINRMEEELKQLNEEIIPLVAQLQERKAEIKDLEKTIRDFEREKERKTKEMKKEIKEERKKLEKLKKALQDCQDRKNRLQFQRQNAEKERADLNKHTEDLQKDIEESNKRLEAEKDDFFEKEKALKKLTDEYTKAQSEAEKGQKEIAEMRTNIEELETTIDQLQDRIKDLVEEETRLKRIKVNAKEGVKQLEKANKWILEERDNFGKEGGDFDWNENPIEQVRKQQAKYKEALSAMDGKVNKTVQEQFARNNEEAKELRNKRNLVEEDQKTLEGVIADLEDKKKRAVEDVYAKVNDYFDKIFSKLLPGTKCKLVPTEGKTVHDGLEIRVAFCGSDGNPEWRESLSELSGGQKSLLSLSLILALLKHKPAPMYILDEIDSALDLSHTQNIGMMLKTHFNDSQFIVVSLKPGLFQNANVLFKTRLASGVSQVDRTVGNA